MNSKPRDLRVRTLNFAKDVLKLCQQIPHDSESGTLKRQLLRAATSVGANYRAALRARSRRDFLSKLSIVEEEADECIYWLELLETAGTVTPEKIAPLSKEADELVAITVASKRTVKRKGQEQESRFSSTRSSAPNLDST